MHGHNIGRNSISGLLAFPQHYRMLNVPRGEYCRSFQSCSVFPNEAWRTPAQIWKTSGDVWDQYNSKAPTGTLGFGADGEAPKRASAPFFCAVCGVTLNAQAQYEAHIAGAKHKRKLNTASQTGANASIKATCSTTTTATATSSTTATTTGNSSAAETPGDASSDDPSAPPSEGAVDPSTDNATGKSPKKRKVTITCDLCNIELNSEIHAKMHFDGQKHAKKVKASELASSTETSAGGVVGSMFYCQFCSIHLNSQEQMEAHRSGNKHKRSLAKQRGEALGPGGPRATPGVRRFQQPQNKRPAITCTVCHVLFKSFPELQQHLSTPEHKQRLKDNNSKVPFAPGNTSGGGATNGNYDQAPQTQSPSAGRGNYDQQNQSPGDGRGNYDQQNQSSGAGRGNYSHQKQSSGVGRGNYGGPPKQNRMPMFGPYGQIVAPQRPPAPPGPPSFLHPNH